MPRRKYDEEKYCVDCGELLNDCECEEEESITLDDVNKFLDTTKKGLDVLDKFQKISKPKTEFPQVPYYAPTTVTHDMIKDTQTNDQKKKEDEEKERREHKKWKIDTAIKIGSIVVSSIVALIVASKFIH
ncbi:MAG: hypothetical protein ACREBB_10165 [Nitrosotalea sp.]